MRFGIFLGTFEIKKLKQGEDVQVLPQDPIHLLPILRSALATKVEQYREVPHVSISYDREESAFGSYVQVMVLSFVPFFTL